MMSENKNPLIIDIDIKTRRKQYGVHLSNLSEALGISRHTLMKMEEDKKIPAKDYANFHKMQPILFPDITEL